MDTSEMFSRFGTPERVYRPSPGQTIVGTLLCVGGAAACFAAAVFGSAFETTNRLFGALFGSVVLGLAVWIYRQRRWRVALFSGGLVQVRPGGVDEVLWPDVREVIQTRHKGYGDGTVRLTLVVGGGRVVVNPINFRSRSRMFAALATAAERHGIPLRVEWEEV